MSHKNTNRNTFIIAALCIAFLMLDIFHYQIHKHSSSVVVFATYLIHTVIYFALPIYIAVNIVLLYGSRHNLTFRKFIPILIASATFAYVKFSPWRIDSENLESKVKLQACYEGTQNQATIKFREDKTFELHWTGAFGYNKWYTGTYTQKSDTLFLHYQTEMPERFGDTVINAGDRLISLSMPPADSTKTFAPFYLGHCLGLN